MSFATGRIHTGICASGSDGSVACSSPAQKQQQASAPVSAHSEAASQWQTLKLLLAGGVAGAFAKSCTAPLARMTILYQVGALQPAHGVQGLSHSLRHVVHTEGVLALWKGNGINIMHRLPSTAVNFMVYEQANQALMQLFPSAADGTSAVDSVRRLLAGGAAGMAATSVAYPLDLLRTRLAGHAGNGVSVAQLLFGILNREGMRGLYHGLGPTLLQAGPNLAINYCVYESLRSKWLADHPDSKAPPVSAMVVFGSASGIVSSSITFPLDVIRRRMQMQGSVAGGVHQYSGIGNALVKIVRHEGIRGLYSGIVPEYIKVAPAVAITYCSYEFMKSFLLGQDFNSKR
mmetsp:Transcript_152/g.546  ORF Transcript_152/g.546 Transcript_152/m.546 type:complete len:346 (+) Transcript_152:265-1302(+)